MDIFEAVVDEIALSGLEGCTPKELWHHLSNRKCPNTFPLALDEQAKCYIWSLLHEASTGIINFYVLKSARQFQEDTLAFTYRLVSDSGTRGSCWEYDTREDVTSAILNDDASGNLNQVITRYGEDQLVMVAIQEVRVKALSSPSMDPMYSINDVQYCALEAVGKARDKGILRTHLTNKYLKIDPRSTYHHVGVLQSNGTVIIKSHLKGYQLFLTRFSAYADQLTDEATLSEKVCNMLLQAPDHCLPESEIVRELGQQRRYRRIKTEMLNKGLVEIVKYSDGEVDKSQLRLIKPLKRAAAVAPSTMSGEGLDLEESHDDPQEGGSALQKHYVVAERLFEMQAYRVVNNAGPSGMTGFEFYQSIRGVDHNTKKIALANISKQGCVVSVLIDDDKVKKYRYISSHQAGKSSDIRKLKSEAKKAAHTFTLAIRSKDASLIDQDTENSSIPTAASGSLEPPTTSLTVAESTLGGDANDSVMGEDVEVEGILKNASHDIGTTSRPDSATSTPTLLTDTDFHKRMEVKGIPLRKMERINFILECIETEKVIMSKFIMHRKMIEFETQKGITAKVDRKTLSKLLQSLVDKGMVNVKTVQLPFKSEHSIYYHSSVTETQLSDAIAEAQEMFGFKESTKKKKARQLTQKSKDNNDSDDVIITIPETLLDLKDDGFVLIPAASKFQRLQHLHLFLWILQYGLPDDAKLSSVAFPWIPAVSKVDGIENTIRWRMMVSNMPLSLLIITVGVHQKRMPKKLYQFIQRSENRNLLLRQLPKSIQLYINAKKRDVVRIYELLQMLEDMKLIIIHQPTAKLIKINVEVEMLRSCSILDTSNTKARHSMFVEEYRSKLNSITFEFGSVSNVQAYWYKLKSVCMMTKIYRQRGDITPDDEGALRVPGHRKESKDYNKLGFGAGGLPPLMYSNIMYNWATMTFFKSEQELQYLAADDKPILPEITYTNLPKVLPDDSSHNVKGQSHNLVISGRCKRKFVALDVDSATVSAAKRVKKAASQKLHKKKPKLSRSKEKFLVWSKEEDGVLMRCHVALSVLNACGLPIPTPIEIREMIRDWTPNRLKHGVVIQRHMNDICSRDSEVCELLKTCVDQLQHTIEMGCGPPLNFKSLLHYLIDNYTGCVPILNVTPLSPAAPPTVALPVTLQELKGSCEVYAPHDSGLLLPPVRTVSDIRKSMLIDLIIAVMGAGSDCYNEYTAFHLFEEYLEQELEDAIVLLKSLLLVKQRRMVDRKTNKHLGPSATQTLVLHNNFYSRLESSFPCQLFEDIYTHLASLGSAPTESAPKEEEWTPGGGEIAAKLHVLAGSNYFCSPAVDSYISNLASCNAQLSSCYFVGRQNVSDIPPLDDEDDECEDDDKENTRVERMISACLPYHTSIHIPENRNFCDLTFRHGYAVGSLLACDDSSPAGCYPSDNSQCLMDLTEHSTEYNRECVVDSTGSTVDNSRAAALGDHIEHSTEKMECNVGHTLDSTEPMVEHKRVGDHVEYSVEHDVEHNIEHMVDNSGPTVEQPQGHTTEHSMEQSVVESNEGTAGHVKYDPQLSIDEYLQICMKHLNYSETDVMFAKYLYDTICRAGVMGVPLRQLEQFYHIGITMTTSEHLQQLKNFEMVIEVGVQVVSLVAAEHKKVWLLHMEKQRSPDDYQQFTKCRPWTSFHGQEFTGMYQRMQNAVLFYIMDYPGVTLHAVEHHFNGIMQLNSLRDILEVLILSGCISCHRIIRERSCELFTSNQTIIAPSGLHDDIPSNIYFEPLSGCEVLHASSLQPSNNVVT